MDKFRAGRSRSVSSRRAARAGYAPSSWSLPFHRAGRVGSMADFGFASAPAMLVERATSGRDPDVCRPGMCPRGPSERRGRDLASSGGERDLVAVDGVRERGGDTARGRVLVIDDDVYLARSLERLLRPHYVELAVNGADGLAALRNYDYDVVLCDLIMPKLTGMDLFAIVRDELPIVLGKMVFMTADMSSSDVRWFTEVCPLPIFEKPFEPRWVCELVREYVEKASALTSSKVHC